jgi:hypothetical protein
MRCFPPIRSILFPRYVGDRAFTVGEKTTAPCNPAVEVTGQDSSDECRDALPRKQSVTRHHLPPGGMPSDRGISYSRSDSRERLEKNLEPPVQRISGRFPTLHLPSVDRKITIFRNFSNRHLFFEFNFFFNPSFKKIRNWRPGPRQPAQPSPAHPARAPGSVWTLRRPSVTVPFPFHPCAPSVAVAWRRSGFLCGGVVATGQEGSGAAKPHEEHLFPSCPWSR